MTLRDMLPGLLVVLALVGCGGEPPPGETPGFAGLGEASEGFVPASPGMTLRFPEDHGPHPATRIEWWYLTANLKDTAGEPLGLQWTLFRQALAPPPEAPPEARPAPGPWATDQLWMAHMAVSRGATHRVAERFARSHSRQGDGQAGVRAQPFAAWLDDWRLESRVDDPDADTFERLTLVAHQDDAHGGFGYRLELTAEGPLVLHGEAGFSQKTADGQGSMYYSQPFWRIEGEVTLDGETRAVSGRGWLDREWSSQLLEPEQSGWDWVALHLDSGPDGLPAAGRWRGRRRLPVRQCDRPRRRCHPGRSGRTAPDAPEHQPRRRPRAAHPLAARAAGPGARPGGRGAPQRTLDGHLGALLGGRGDGQRP